MQTERVEHPIFAGMYTLAHNDIGEVIILIANDSGNKAMLALSDEEARKLRRLLAFTIADNHISRVSRGEAPPIQPAANGEPAILAGVPTPAPTAAKATAKAPSKPSLRLATLDGAAVEEETKVNKSGSDNPDDDKPPPKGSRYLPPVRFDVVEASAA